MARNFCTAVKIVADDVLSTGNRQRTVEFLKRLQPVSAGKMISKRRAAVLVPICLNQGELSLLLTIRGKRLRSNSGQVAFPGGMEDLDDKSLEETVLRETLEEVGIEREKVDVWGPGPLVGRAEMTVTPFLATIGVVDPTRLNINPEEVLSSIDEVLAVIDKLFKVERAFTTPLATFCEMKHFGVTEFRSKNTRYVLPVFKTSEFKMWGLTALITHIVLTALIPQFYHHKIPRQVMSSTNLPRVVFAAFFLICETH